MFGRKTTTLRRGGKLHVGCGPVKLEGWINIDNQPYPAADHVLDVTAGLPFEDLDCVFAEHFIEHLGQEAAMQFLRNCRQALKPDGILRLTTPSLDWVYFTQYHPSQWTGETEAIRDCFWINKAFRGWGHQFLYNRPTLTACLRAAGFETVEHCNYGESRHDVLRGIERHEKYLDSPELPHILIAEASGVREPETGVVDGPQDEFRQATSVV